MKEAILRVHDYLAQRKWLVWLLLAVLAGLFALSASRMGYQEDISAFLPHDAERYASVYERLGGQDKIAVFFEPSGEGDADIDAIIGAMECFESTWRDRDTLEWVPDLQAAVGGDQIRTVLQFILSHAPYFLTEADYARMDSLLARVYRLRQQDSTAVIIVSLHWGQEHKLEPVPRQRHDAHMLVHAGADVLVCHHTHTLQSVEDYGGRKIYYSIGNFIFDQPKPLNARAAMVRLRITADSLSVETLPVEIRHCAPHIK